MRIPPALERVVAALARLPGVGEKTAVRFAFHILGETPTYAQELAGAVAELHGAVRHCARCHNLADEELCQVCRSPGRDGDRICVVEGIQELIAIERTGEYRGLYHVLHGVLSPVQGIGPDQLTIRSLLERVCAVRGGRRAVTEVVLATNTDVEGEATALYLRKQILHHAGVAVTRIAMGVPMGGDIELLDEITLARALRDRREL